MENLVICPNCDAKIDIHSEKCPYCGYINNIGAEEKYMEKLSGIREKLDKVDNDAREKYSGQMNSVIKKLAVIFGILAILTILLNGLIRLMDDNLFGRDEKRTTDTVEEIKWQREFFPKVDKLYADGDYEELVAVYFSDETDYHEIYNWEHYDFTNTYRKYVSVRDCYIPMLDEGNFDADSAAGMIYDSFYLYYEVYSIEYAVRNKLSDEDMKVLEEKREYIVDVVRNRMNFSEEQMEDFKAKGDVLSDGYFAYSDCKKLARKYYKQFK